MKTNEKNPGKQSPVIMRNSVERSSNEFPRTPTLVIATKPEKDLSNVCEHRIIEDLIDITPDKSQTVYYCEKCLECFSQ